MQVQHKVVEMLWLEIISRNTEVLQVVCDRSECRMLLGLCSVCDRQRKNIQHWWNHIDNQTSYSEYVMLQCHFE